MATLAISVAPAGCGGGGRHEASKSPQQIAADAVAATEHLHSFRLAGTITDANGSIRVTEAIAGPGRIRFSEQRGGELIQVIALGPATYMKAGLPYYSAQPNLSAAQVARFADRWLKLSTASHPSFAAAVRRSTNFSLELRCWAARKRGLSVAGTGTVGGRDAVIIASDGSAPGSAPGKVYVAATGPAWPLRAVTTGPRKPGGSGACYRYTTVRSSDITVSDFDQPISLAAPASALDLTR